MDDDDVSYLKKRKQVQLRETDSEVCLKDIREVLLLIAVVSLEVCCFQSLTRLVEIFGSFPLPLFREGHCIV